MNLLILTRLQPGEQSGIIPVEPFERFPTNLFQRRRFPRVKPLKRLGKIRSQSTWLKPGENESRRPVNPTKCPTEPGPRRLKSPQSVPVSHRLTAVCGGLAAMLFLLSAFCFQPSVQSQNQPPPAQPQPSPTPSPTPTPSPSPTPPPNLHQWGALTSFHGLPSDRARAIAQEKSGVTWFATDGGLAMFNGRRTHAVIAEGLPKGRVLALKIDDSGAIWIGTDTGAAWMANGKTHPIKETSGKAITTIVTRDRDHVLMASENGQIFDCRVQRGAVSEMRAGEGVPQVSFNLQAIPTEPLQSTDKDQPGPLKITSLALVGDKLYVGTHSRGVLVIENGDVKEVVSRPRSFFINALETDAKGRLWAGARGGKEESAIFDQSDPLKPVRANAPTGPVTAIARGAGEDIWVATDGRGAFHLRDGKLIERFTFVGTGGALRSDHIYGVFVDQEDVVWFATDKGVCRYDPNAARTEVISSDANSNYVRALWRTSKGSLLAGTNAGLFVHDAAESVWSPIADVGRRIVYAISEDNSGRVLIGTSSGLLASSNRNELAFARVAPSSNNLPEGDSVRAIANVDGATYIATYGYGVEKLNGSQRTFLWPAPSADNRLREVTALGRDPTGPARDWNSHRRSFFLGRKRSAHGNSARKTERRRSLVGTGGQ